MSAEMNLGFRRDGSLDAAPDGHYAPDRHTISFQSGSSLSSASQMIPFGSCFGFDTSTMTEMMFPVNSSLTDSSTGFVQAQTSSSTCSPLLDSVSGFKHDAGLAVEWSVEEQYKLEEGLAKYSDEPRIMSYIKIAAMLPDKTVRDVALRCQWISRKRRKHEEINTGKRMNIRMEEAKICAAPPLSVKCLDERHNSPFEGISGPFRHLLEQNFEAFSQITVNFSSFKVQDNIELFGRTRNNIEAILNDLKGMPGIMSQMPPLPVSIDEDLVRCIFPNVIQSMMHGSQTGTRLKQEPRG